MRLRFLATLLLTTACGVHVNPEGAARKIPILRAAIDCDGDSLKALQAHVDQKDENGYTALDWALIKDCDAAVAVLLEAGADPNHEGPYGHLPLSAAAHQGDLQLMKLLLAHGADPAADPRIVHSATIHVEQLRLLADLGVDLLATDRFGATALHHAPSAESIRFLVEHGLDPNVATHHGSTPLQWAAGRTRGEESVEAVRALLAAGADVNARDIVGGTPLLSAARQPNPHVIRILLDAGAAVHARNQEGETALGRVRGGAQFGEHPLVRTLAFVFDDVRRQVEEGEARIAEAERALLAAGASL